ncbi:FAD synthase [uncultured Alistipes sp.]|uniref:FAD synthase n=1 Tax=uncultured Alistipes sp. TaxID=538949 RepID=UPI002621E8B8|nr:FAD synthase [uncultured Alistipes sp.]
MNWRRYVARAMKVFQGFEDLPHFIRPAVTVGSFDGVHRGHRALIGRLVAEARAVGGESVVLTFEPHPRITLGRAEGLRLLTTFEEKVALLAELGVDNVIVIPFDRAFSALSGREFVERCLIGRVGAETLVAGYNHRFGHDGVACDAPEVASRLRVVRVGPCTVDGMRVSSTAIRRLLDAGDRTTAEHLAGHPLSEHRPAPERGNEESKTNQSDTNHGKPRL